MLEMIVGLVMVGSPLPFSELVATSTPQKIWQEELAQCESTGSTTIAIIDSNGYWSRGKYMYQLKTWLHYGKIFGIKTTRENIFDEKLQDEVTRYVLDTYSWDSDWITCGIRTTKKLGDYASLGSYPYD